ncbi:histidine phosphatase family protein [Candidatus Micrarchaeota archaeon]|nr:histidine phosphatase family protein [Candidatus Micrarchaeota archaeon]
MRLILVRHGRTEENVRGVYQGHTPGVLTELGWGQARKLGERLKGEKLDAIYSSDLGRTADTAREVIKFHPKTPVVYTPLLRERDLASLVGKLKSEWHDKPKPNGVETKEAMNARAKKILGTAYDKYPSGTVLFAGHNGINRVLISLIIGKNPQYSGELERQKDTAVNIFEIREGDDHEIILLNDASHLD